LYLLRQYIYKGFFCFNPKHIYFFFQKHDLVTAKSHNTCSFYGKHKSERIRNSRGDKGPSCFRQSRRLRGEDPVVRVLLKKLFIINNFIFFKAFIDRPINLLEDYSTEGSHNEKSFTVERPYKSGTLPKSLSRFVLTTVTIYVQFV
jgi:hypothetical protein